MKRVSTFYENFIFNLEEGKWYYLKGIKDRFINLQKTPMEWLIYIVKLDLRKRSSKRGISGIKGLVTFRSAPVSDFKALGLMLDPPSQKAGDFKEETLEISNLRVWDFMAFELSNKERKKIVEKMMINSL